MKYLLQFAFSMLFLLAGFSLFAQDTSEVVLPLPIEPGVAITTLVDWVDVVFAGLINVAGFFTQFIPGLNKVSSKAWRVIAIALVLGAVFIILGWSNAIGLVLAFLAATNFYNLVLKEIFGKKEVKPSV